MFKFFSIICFLFFGSAFSEDINLDDPKRDSRCVKTPVQGDDDFVRGVTGSYVNGQKAKDLIKRTSTDDYSVSGSSTVEDNIHALIVQVDKLQERKTLIIKELNESKKVVDEKESNIKKKETEISSIKTQIAELKVEKTSLSTELESSKTQITELKSRIAKQKEGCTNLGVTIKDLQGSIGQKETEISSLNAHIEKLTKELEDGRKLLVSEKGQLALEREKAEYNSNKNDLMKKTIETMDKEIVDLRGLRDSLLSENVKFRSDLTLKAEELKGAKLSDLKSQIDGIKTLMDQQTTAMQKINDADARYNELRGKVNGLIDSTYIQLEIDVGKGEHKDIDSRISEFKREVQLAIRKKNDNLLRLNVSQMIGEVESRYTGGRRSIAHQETSPFHVPRITGGATDEREPAFQRQRPRVDNPRQATRSHHNEDDFSPRRAQRASDKDDEDDEIHEE